MSTHALKLPIFLALTSVLLLAAAPSEACPYSSIQVRVQPNTSQPWVSSTTVNLGNSVHVGVFKNGWGVPVDPGTVSLYAVQGSSWQPVSLSNGWETYFTGPYAATWSFVGYCGSLQNTATATFTSTIDVLSYIRPGGVNGGVHSVISDKGNPWRVFSDGGNVGERLPGFFFTKGNLDYNTYLAWNFEQMIYDNQWIYLVRDTSWTSKCTDNNREAGMLLFTYEGGQWKRGGRHFPRFIQSGTSVDTGSKYIQGVEKKLGPNDNTAQEGRWCTAQYSGWGSTTIYAETVTGVTLGGTYYPDVLKLRATGGIGAGDEWWFAKGIGPIFFGDANQNERINSIANPYEIGVRIPCAPNAPCM